LEDWFLLTDEPKFTFLPERKFGALGNLGYFVGNFTKRVFTYLKPSVLSLTSPFLLRLVRWQFVGFLTKRVFTYLKGKQKPILQPEAPKATNHPNWRF